MEPSTVRAIALRDHVALRARLDRIEARVAEVEPGMTGPCTALVEETEGLLQALTAHMDWEDVHLASALRDIDAWGPEREAALSREHAEQREQLRDILAMLHRACGSAARLAQKTGDFIQRVRRDLDAEEVGLLDADLLRDDVVGIAVEAG